VRHLIFSTIFVIAFICSAKAQTQFASVDDQLAYFVSLQEEELAKYDIAYLNLVCAQGLNGSENLDIPACLAKLDEMAKHIDTKTKANFNSYEKHPGAYENNKGHFKAICMVTFAVMDYGIEYNPDRIESVDKLSPNNVFFADSRDVFINGMLQRNPPMGTCSSLPVLWVAIGRRIGYPLCMSNTMLHFFVRWKTEKDSFDFEGTQNGCGINDDDFYRTWPVSVDDKKIKYWGLLTDFTRKEELMHFLVTRGDCLAANKRFVEARRAYIMAYCCCPNHFSDATLYMNRNLPTTDK
jgi:hypothetical protein